MGDPSLASVSGLVFAAIVALLLFGVFLNRRVKDRLIAWWKGLDLGVVLKPNDPEVVPKRMPEERLGSSRAPHAAPPHVEKKEAHTHRSG